MFGGGGFGATQPSMFGAATPAAAAAPSPGGGMFGATPAAAPSAFGGLSPLQPGSAFGAAPTPGVPGQQAMITTKDGKPITHETKWDDISPQGQQELQKLEERIFQFREECRQMDSCERLKDSAALRQGMEAEATDLSNTLKGLSSVVSADKQSLHSFKQDTMKLMRDTEVAVNTYERVRAKKESIRAAEAGQPIPPSVMDRLGGATPVPSPFVQDTCRDLEETLSLYQHHIEELERLFMIGGAQRGGEDVVMGGTGGSGDVAEALPAILRDSHDYLVHVAAQVEAVHERTEGLKEQFLRARRQRGDTSDPFAEAERKERAQREAAAKSSAPTVPPPAMPGAAVAAAALPGGGGVPAVTTPAAAAPALGAAGTPGASLFGAAPAAAASGAAPSLFGAATTPTPAAGSTPAGGLFGAAPAAAGTPSAFGAAAPAVATAPTAFGAAPAAGGGLFGAAPAAGGFGAPPAAGAFGAPAAGGFGAPAAGAASGSKTGRSRAKRGGGR